MPEKIFLKPCPVCGDHYASQVFDGATPKVIQRFKIRKWFINKGKPVSISRHPKYISSFWVACNNCDTKGPVADTEDGAIEKWNFRPIGEYIIKEK